MASIELFPRNEIVGVFRGFREGGLEFHAELVLPYRGDFHALPMHGQFVLVQLETPQEAVLGRITAFSAEGKLASPSGEEFNIRAVRDHRPIPDDLREDYLRYRVNIRVLGVLRHTPDRGLTFVPSHRRLPHLGSPVAFPSGEVLRHIAGHDQPGAAIGYFALGEYIYGRECENLAAEPWMQFKKPEVGVKFPVEALVSRRTFVFARAGFGKSNLIKLLFSKLYETEPTVEKRGGRRVPVGSLIFDPDGEYFWPDDKGRPGLADVPHLQDTLVVFTDRHGPSPYYDSFVAGPVRLDIRRLRPGDVVAIALSPERQEQQNVRKLASLSLDNWTRLVDLIDHGRNQTDLEQVSDIIGLDRRQEVEALAARSNMTTIVQMLHDRNSRLLDMLVDALAQGKLCVVDLSRMRGTAARVLSGLILRRIFDRNQEEFTKADPRTIPTIAVIEEAQTVLNEGSTTCEPFVAWVKEGRKYDLGAVLITQQPGSIPTDVLSQGDNWFIFHLLSATDLTNVRRANAHFSDDMLSVLLNEPIPGNGVFWSSVSGTPYPLSFRAFSFEQIFQVQDQGYSHSAVHTAATALRRKHEEQLAKAIAMVGGDVDGQASLNGVGDASTVSNGLPTSSSNGQAADMMEILHQCAVAAIKQDSALMSQLQSDHGVPWRTLGETIKKGLPGDLDDRDNVAFRLVPKALTSIFGDEGKGWRSYKRRNYTTDKDVTYVKALLPVG